MSGRGGRNGGNRGRGRRFAGRSSNRGIKSEIKKNLSDYNYYVGSAKQALDYESTTKFLINHIKKTFEFGNDIRSALKDLKPVDTDQWKPSMQVSISPEDKINEAETRQLEIEFKADYDAYRKRVQTYDNNQTKAYALLWERCMKGMKNKIEARSDYESKIENDPIQLLKAIKEHALNYQESRYSMSIILDALRTLLGAKQKDNESLQDYTKRFRVAKEVLESHIGGPMILTKIVEAMKDYDKANKEKQESCQKKAFEQFLAYLYLENAD